MATEITDSLTGKWAVITGSSSGIGRAVAIEFAAAGANLVLHGNRRLADAERFAKTLREQGHQVVVLGCDFSDHGSLGHFVEQAWEVGPVDIWVNNAGADVLTGTAADTCFDDKLNQLWQVDVMATVALSREIGRRMKLRGTGVILNMGWDQAEWGMAGDSGEMFATTKGAIMTFSRSLAKSLAPEVRVNCLAPGWIKTAWGDTANNYWQSRARSESLLERWGTPEDVAQAARFLASPAARFITGHTLPVNGGRP